MFLLIAITCIVFKHENYNSQISRTGVYTRLLPRKSNTSEGKRHVVTVPVRLRRAFIDSHKSHSDALFCRAAIGYLEDIASVLGPDQVLFISQDDKVSQDLTHLFVIF